LELKIKGELVSQVIQFHPRKVVEQTGKALSLSALPPLALYVHIPWCVKKCPYCDFNSHEFKISEGDWEKDYINAILKDLENTLPLVWGRRLVSVFIGGGTPSILSPESIDTLLAGIRARMPYLADMEITMEANPGTLDNAKLKGFRDAGVNRLSLGVQSFNDEMLHKIGRIHDGKQAREALDVAYQLFDKVNLDIMFALPNQTFDQLQSDVQIALSYQPTHVSYYHLTLEPNTYFHRYPPILPDDEIAIDMQEYIESALSEAGLCHYEVSAYARAGHESIHNTNYWQFGDYIGIGAGAHGKISMHNRIVRQARYKSPHMYLSKIASGSAIEIEHDLTTDELPFEFMLNALRLRNGAKLSEFMAATGLTVVDLEPALSEARAKGLMDASPEVLRTTDLGWRFLSDVQTMFLK
jgi:oxygen-independent coproporphyrinogen-3 oxidase